MFIFVDEQGGTRESRRLETLEYRFGIELLPEGCHSNAVGKYLAVDSSGHTLHIGSAQRDAVAAEHRAWNSFLARKRCYFVGAQAFIALLQRLFVGRAVVGLRGLAATGHQGYGSGRRQEYLGIAFHNPIIFLLAEHCIFQAL